MAVKDQIIKLLEENRDQWLSGQEMANRLLVSRAAIWKAIKTLEKEGFQISAVTNLGYRLNADTDVLSAQGIAHYLKKSDIPILTYKSIDSTNTELKRLALCDAKDCTLVVTDHQTAGRGRFNRNFYSPDKTGIYMSLLLRHQQSLADATVLTMLSAVAVKRAIYNITKKEVTIKWVNDLYYQDRKVCGILTEAMSDFESGMLEALIIGIGINMKSVFPDELKDIATSLDVTDIPRNQLIAEVVNQLLLALEEPIEGILLEYKAASFILNKTITFKKNNQEYIGIAKDINSSGHLIVEVEGELISLLSGEISVRSIKNEQ